MKIKLTQEQTDFIVQTFGCKDGGEKELTDELASLGTGSLDKQNKQP